MNDPILPPARPLPADVRDRTLRSVLRQIEDDEVAPPPTRWRSRGRVLAAAAAVVVVAASSIAVLTQTGGGPGIEQLPPATQDVAPAPPPVDVDLPPSSGDPGTDEALARCATAVVASGLAEDYPPTGEWTATYAVGTGAIDTQLVVDDSFGCSTSPTSVTVSGTSGTPAGPVEVVRMSTAGELLVLNPDRRRGWIGRDDRMSELSGAVQFVDLFGDETPDGLTVEFDGARTPLPADPVRALTVVDRPVPVQGDTPEQRELAACITLHEAHPRTDPALWRIVARHDVAGAPPALVARVGEAAAGFCIFGAGDGPVFWPAPAPGRDVLQPVAYYLGESRAVLLAVTPDVTRVEVAAPAGARRGPTPCTVADGLAMCTTDTPSRDGADRPVPMVVTAYLADAPDTPVEVYRN